MMSQFNSGDNSQFPNINTYPIEYIQQLTNNFEQSLVIGRGGFGVVYRAQDPNSSQIVAIKTIAGPAHDNLLKTDTVNYEANIRDFFTALDFAQKIHKDGVETANILPLLFSSMTPDKSIMCLAYRYMPNGSVHDWLDRRNGTLNWQRRVNIAIGTANGLRQLHMENIMHLDIKSPNILLDENLQPFISDFGFARGGPAQNSSTHRTVTSISGTEPWLPEDYLRTRHLCDKVDIYSYGIFLLELLTGKLPIYQETSNENTLLHIFLQSRMPEQKMDIPSTMVNYLDDYFDNPTWLIITYKYAKNCTHENSRHRPNIGQILEGMVNLRDATLRRMASQS